MVISRNASAFVSLIALVVLTFSQPGLVGASGSLEADGRTVPLLTGGSLAFHPGLLSPIQRDTRSRSPQPAPAPLPPRGMFPGSRAAADMTSPGPRFAALVGSVTPGPDLQSTYGFDGLSACEGQACGEPPDPWVAVGPQHVVQAVNQQLRISSRTGTTVETIPFPTFFAEPGGQIGGSFDPHVIYVAQLGRWIALAASFDCAAGHLYLAISGGSDPTGAWTRYQFDYLGYLPDYPTLGVSSDKVVLSSNLFAIVAGSPCQPSTFGGSVLDVVDTASLTAGGALPFSETTPSSSYFTWRPATALSATTTVHMVAEAVSGHVAYGRITGTNAASNLGISTSDLTATTALPGFAQPPTPHGATGFTSDTVDGRPTDALWLSGTLWFVSTYPCVPQSDSTARDCVRVTALGTAGTTPSTQQDFLIGSVGKDYFMGGIGLAADGTLFMVFAVSSDTDFIGSYASMHFPADPPDTYRVPILPLHDGAAAYQGARWGDYVGVAQDPSNPHRVWQGNEYANASGKWSTWISRLSAIFTDISTSTFRDDIIWLFYAGITKGCTVDRFCPDDNVTRGQMAAFLDRALSLPSTTTDYFSDDDTSIYQTDINRLAAAGITKGCSPTTFCPDDNVTRGQMAAFLVRALDLPSTTTDYFTDDNGTTFEHDINALAASGITKGCTPTTFCPDDNVTRGQMSAFLHRALG